MRFQDRTIAITGASRGLGREIAIGFAREGGFVAIGYRSRRDEAEATLDACRGAGGSGELMAVDVRDRSQVREAFARLEQQRGGIDVLVNNAGVQHHAPLALSQAEDWDEVLAVNLGGAYNCTYAVARPMMARQRGAIVNVASAAALRATEGRSSYASSKAGLLGFTRVVARELAPHGVRVNALVPGYVATGMAARMDHQQQERVRATIPLGRFAKPDEVTAAALFLASDEARYVVGHALVVDGGVTL